MVIVLSQLRRDRVKVVSAPAACPWPSAVLCGSEGLSWGCGGQVAQAPGSQLGGGGCLQGRARGPGALLGTTTVFKRLFPVPVPTRDSGTRGHLEGTQWGHCLGPGGAQLS